MMLHIRQYQLSDLAAVWNLHHLALQHIDADAGIGIWDDDLHDIENVYLANGGEFLVGECEQQVVAMGALQRVTVGKAEIRRMRVHPAHQGRGYGNAILDALETRAVQMGYEVLVLDTTVKQEVAQSLYRNRGYHVSDCRGDVIYMERRIP